MGGQLRVAVVLLRLRWRVRRVLVGAGPAGMVGTGGSGVFSSWLMAVSESVRNTPNDLIERRRVWRSVSF